MTEDEKKKTANLEDVQAFGRIIHNKGIGSEGTCSTAAATAAKTVTVGTTFKPVAGATLIVTFQNAITVANATLAVTYGASGSQQTLAAKPIYYRGSALAANLVEAGATLVLRYDGTNYNIIGSLQSEPFPSQSGNSGKFLKTDGSAVSWASIPSDNTKTDKLPMTGAGAATENNFMAIDVNGNIKDSGKNENSFQLKVFDCAMLGGGYAVCSTAAATAAKEVAITNYELVKNCIVSIKFQNGISINGATLNVNSTGAKPIYLDGTALQAGVIKENSTVTLQYDGTNWNVVGGGQGISTDDELLVDLGLPSGLKWATRNLDVTQANGFAASPYQYDCSFFSWGNTDGHNPISDDAFQYDFGTSNSGPYASTHGSILTGDTPLGYDAAHINLGGNWRIPTKDDFAELFNPANTKFIDASGNDIPSSTINKVITMNGVKGIRLMSLTNGKTIFFACSGLGQGKEYNSKGFVGLYWSNTLYAPVNNNGYCLAFLESQLYPQYTGYYRYYGLSIRPVYLEQKETLKISLNQLNGNNADLNGASVTVVNNSTSENIYSGTWSGSAISIQIPIGTEYTITVGSVVGYKLFEQTKVGKADVFIKDITFTYYGHGAYIEGTNHRLYTASQWADAYQIPNAIVLLTTNKNFKMEILSGLKYNSDGFRVRMISSTTPQHGSTNIFGLTEYASAPLDNFNGKAETDAIYAYNMAHNETSPDTYAAVFCKDFIFPDGTKGGFIPSTGYLALIQTNAAAIASCLNTLSGNTIGLSMYIQSCTMSSNAVMNLATVFHAVPNSTYPMLSSYIYNYGYNTIVVKDYD